MGIIKERFKAKSDSVGAEIKELLKEHGNKVIVRCSFLKYTRE
jgi:citrate synthase